MTEKLQKIIAARGIASRRRAEEIIAAGLVTVNGEPASLGDRADPGVDTILVEGKPLPPLREYVYIMLNKPRGYVTTLSDEKGRPNAAQLVADCGCRVYPIGRLDMDSEGLLLFTNDGDFANRVMHPSHEIEKTYEVKVTGFTQAGFVRLAEPMELDGYQIRPPKLTLQGVNGPIGRFQITIHEGRNRQIRRMCDAVGMKVLRLKRIREGKLELGKLPPGKWRYLSQEEIKCI